MITHKIYFHIPKLLQHPFLQTSLASIKIKNYHQFINQISQLKLIKTKKQIKLLGAYTKSPNNKKSKGLVILLHGWEGSINSTYITRMGIYLLNQGFDIFRLNLRDHGNTHHLNEGLFLGTLIEEVYDGITEIIKEYKLPSYVIGFSLGGNFAIRLALLYNSRIRNKIKQNGHLDLLEFILAVSPVADPKKSTFAIDSDKIYKRYFLKKWKYSLIQKQNFFPYIYNFEFIQKINSIWELTELGILKYTEYSSIDEYFSKYTLRNFSFDNLKIPIYILSSYDDPIIPVEDFSFLNNKPSIKLYITEKGGHNGFIMDFQFHCYYMELFTDIIKNQKVLKYY